MAQLTPGDIAPAFALSDQDGRPVRLSDFKGRTVLIYFYPRAGTSGWTKQAISVRDAMPELDRLGVAALAISPDSPVNLKKFSDKQGLPFPLLSDPDHAIAEAYGAWGRKNLYGKISEGIIRSAFLIDDKGIIRAAFYKISPQDTVPKTLAVLKNNAR